MWPALSLRGICILPNIAAAFLTQGTILDTSMQLALSLRNICILPNIVAAPLIKSIIYNYKCAAGPLFKRYLHFT